MRFQKNDSRLIGNKLRLGLKPANAIKSGQRLSPNTEFKKGQVGYSHWTGKKFSKEVIEKKSGKNHYNWKGGTSEYPDCWVEDLKESIRKRDCFICQECGIHQDELNNGQIKKLDVHHKDYNKNNLNPENLISLCRSCHAKTNYNREYWLTYFKK